MIKKEYDQNVELIARYSKALAHPARIAILKFLASQTSCYFGELNEFLPLTKATVSQHMSELKDAGLVQGSFEPPKVRYCINRDNWEHAQELLHGLFASYEIKKINCCD